MSKIDFQNLPDTTTPVNATNLNLIQESNVLMIGYTNDVACSIIGAYTQMTGFSVVNSVGNKITLNNNDEIVIGQGISKIKVSSKISRYSTTAGIKYLYIRKNGENQIWSTINAPSNTYTTEAIPDAVISVSQNDKITFTYFTNQSGDSFNGQLRTYITVEAIQ